jgi:hypothetical protein
MPLEEEEAAAATATNINCRISINTLLMSIQGVGFSVGKATETRWEEKTTEE